MSQNVAEAVDQRCVGTIAVAASFTAEPLLPALRFVLGAAGLSADVRFAPYNQLFQELLAKTSLLGTNTDGVDVVLLRIEDFARQAKTGDEALGLINDTVPEFVSALAHHARRTKIPTIFAVLPASPNPVGVPRSALEAATASLLAQARKLPGLIPLLPEDIDVVATQERFDAVGDEIGHIPFTEDYYSAISAALVRKIHALHVPAHKVLALDCDETLWRGVVGEDGVEGLSIAAPFARLQRFAVDLQATGVLVCLVSKNSERDVLDVFEKRSDMILTLDHVVAHRVNWQPKPQNLASLARTLNLGLDSFVFIDDNPVECELMRSELPQVMTLQLPDEDAIDSFLSNLWAFDKVAVTEEDTRRTAMYRENAARQENEESATDIAAFIASLGVVTDIDAPQEGEWPRLSQLTQRTNQFNFTTVRRTEGEIRAMAAAGTTVLRIRVRDRFGDYGLVGLVIAADAGDTLSVDTFLLSCRVLGRGVEHAILRKLGQIAQERGLARVDVPYIKTSKNEPAFAFIESVAASFRVEQATQIVYSIPADQAITIAHRPGHDPAAVVEARKSEERKSAVSSTTSDGVARSQRYNALAHVLASGSRLTEAVNAGAAKSRSQPWRPESPQTKLEHELLAIWERLLGVRGLGVEDDYAAVGGTSLIAARLFAEIYRRFGTRLPLTTILEAPTVRALAKRLQNERSSAAGALVELKRGASRNLFLIHDGDGETLLYANFARRMPADLAVFGIEPLRLEGVPLAHTTIEAMAAFYLEKVRTKQPYGPYLLGGMCAGGVIAFEMASQLLQGGQEVELLAVLDAAAPGAAKRPLRISKQRLDRLHKVLDQARKADNTVAHRTDVLMQVARKSANAVRWESTERFRRAWVKTRFKLLQVILAQKKSWPAIVQEMTVRQIYDSAEAHYRPKPISLCSTVLVRAKVGEGDDTPYREIYSDETFGWARLVRHLDVVDVDGGHASMLQEPFVDSMVEALQPYIEYKAGSPTTAPALEAAPQ